MQSTKFDTSNQTFLQLFSGGNIFKIPRFQRDYSWKEENWDDLWSDIQDLLNDPDIDSHYMGYLVLQPRTEVQLDVIDGQQRLTTISILVLAAMRILNELINADIDAGPNRERLAEIRRTYIGQLDTVSLAVNPKLSLNRNNNDYYQTYLTTLRRLPTRGFKSSEHAMRKASDWFERRLKDLIDNLPAAESKGSSIAEMIGSISRGLFFTVITVDDDLNAYKVFETLNARGVKLAAPDLLKNYLLSVISRRDSVHDRELDELEARWSQILDRLQSENITSYLRTYWGANVGFVRQSELFKVIKRRIETPQAAYELISGLEDSLDTYLSLATPDESDWEGEDKENAKLLKTFSVRQPFALLMSANQRIPGGFSQILRAIVQVTLRYNVIGNLQAAEQERTYSRVATAITSGEIQSPAEVIQRLRPIYPSDSTFRASFATKVFDTSNSRNGEIVRYLLGRIEAHENNSAYSSLARTITLEHVLPENPHDNWPEFSANEQLADVYRLGNMILLEQALNKSAGNKAFKEKQAFYRQSERLHAGRISELEDEWTSREVDARQRNMARVATAIWRINQLHQ